MLHAVTSPYVREERLKLARQMRGLKMRWKFTRRLKKGLEKGSDKKLSSFNFHAFKEEHIMQAHVNAHPAKARSPLSKVKMECHILRASLQASAEK